MFSETPELYDRIYGAFKDYAGEADRIAELLAEHAGDGARILDVGCGTGEHARHLTERHGYRVAGLDREPGFVELAATKVPSGRFWQGDMADFRLGESFDAVLCLFSTIGYVGSVDRLRSALRCFHAHLRPGGLAVVEPWFEPDGWTHGRVFVATAEDEAMRVVRMSHSGVADGRSVLDFHYLIGTEAGVEHRRERHELALFTRSEMLDAFEGAGFAAVRHDPEGWGRGLYIARAGEGEA